MQNINKNRFLLTSGIVFLVFIIFVSVPVSNQFNTRYLDYLFLTTKVKIYNDQKINLISYGTASLRELGFPIKRSLYSSILDHIDKNNVVVFDILFGKSEDVKGTNEFNNNLFHFNKNIFPFIKSEKWIPDEKLWAKIEPNILNKNDQKLEGPDLPIWNNVTNLGFTEFDLDNDGVLRWYPLVVKLNSIYLPTLALKSYLLQNSLNYKLQIKGDKISRIDFYRDNYFYKSIDLSLDPLGFGRLRLDPSFIPFNINKYEFNELISSDTKIDNGIVFVGASASGISANQPIIGLRNAIPLLNHIIVFSQLSSDSGVKSFSLKIDLLINSIVCMFLMFLCLSDRNSFLFSVIQIFLVVIMVILCSKFVFDQNYVFDYLSKYLILFLGIPVLTVKHYSREQMERRHIQKMFANYLHPKLVDEISNNSTQVELRGEKKYVVTLFSDLRNFTNLTEELEPQVMFDTMNLYFKLGCNSIQGNLGTVDKFIGDAIMAFWNAPVAVSRPEEKAVIAAIDFINNFNNFTSWPGEISKKNKLGVGLGIHAGEVIVGNVGTLGRFNYTIMGDSVNVASRIESLTKYYSREILISDLIYEKLPENLKNDFVFIENIKVKGKSEFLGLYTWVPDFDHETRRSFRIIHQLIHEHDFDLAIAQLDSLKNRINFYDVFLEHLIYFKNKNDNLMIWMFEHK